MYILGLGGSNHGFSACLMEDDKIVCMVDDERITRKKDSVGLGIELAKGYARKYCLEYANISLNQVDYIVGNDFLSPSYYFRLEDKITLINHHMAHACSAFFPSNMEEAAILVMDGVGSKKKVADKEYYESLTFAHGSNQSISILQKGYGENYKGTDYVENSLGIFYALLTQAIGFKDHEEGKTMGLAPYGSDQLYKKIKSYIDYEGNGKVILNKDIIENMIQMKIDIDKITDKDKKFNVCADVAWAAQKRLEEIYLAVARDLYELTKSKNLCIAGGVALNSVANYKLYKEQIFENIFIQPAAGDDGTALGAAMYGRYLLNK